MNITTENTFETALVQSLTEQGGYTEGNATDYSPDLGMFKNEHVQFLKASTPKKIFDLLTENRTTLISEVVTVKVID